MQFHFVLLFCLFGFLPQPSRADAAAVPPFPKSVPMDKQVQNILSGSINYYAGLKSFQADIASTTHIEMTGMKSDMDSSYHIALQRPNSFALIANSGMMGGTVVSDGKKWVTFQSQLKKYTSTDAPALDDLLQPMNLVLIEGGLPFGLEAFLSKDPLKQLQADLTKSEYVGEEKIGTISTQHVRLTGIPYIKDFWIRTGDEPLLLQCEIHQDLSSTFKKLSADQKKKMPMGLNMESMKMSRTSVYSNWQTNQPVAASVFQFTPPPEAQLVDAFYTPPPHPLTDKPAPDFQLNDLDGHPVKLADLRGKIVVLDFWATWCGPCVASLPLVTEVATSFKDRGVVFYAVNLRETAAKIQEFQKNKNLAFPVLLDTDGKVAGLYQAKGIPQTVLIDKTGKIVSVHVGYDPGIKPRLIKQLTALVNDQILPTETSAVSAPAPAAK